MERLTLPSVQSAKQQEYLKRQKSWFQELAENLPTAGWVEGQMHNRPFLQTWAQGLQLTDLTPEDYFNRLARVIIPLQQTLLGAAIPGIDERLKKLESDETEGIRKLRDNFNLDHLFPPIRDYSGILSTPEITGFLSRALFASEQLLRSFLSDSGTSRILNAVVRYKDTNIIRDNGFNQYLAGALFEEIGYQFIKSEKQKNDITILSPEETCILIKNVHPQRKFDDNNTYGLNFSIEGISSPDGLVISSSNNSLNIVSVIEYKNIGQKDVDYHTINKQRQFFTPEQVEIDLRLKNHHPIDPLDLGRLIHAIRPSLPEKPVRVSPELLPIYVIPFGTDFKIAGIPMVKVPISTAAVHAFAQRLKEVKLLQ